MSFIQFDRQAAAVRRQEGAGRFGEPKPLFAPGWYMGEIRSHAPGHTRNGEPKTELTVQVWETPDRQGRTREIKAHLAFGSRNPDARRIAQEQLDAIGEATGQADPRGVDLDAAVGKPLAVRLKHDAIPARNFQSKRQEANPDGTPKMLTINRVNGFDHARMVSHATPAPAGSPAGIAPQQGSPGHAAGYVADGQGGSIPVQGTTPPGGGYPPGPPPVAGNPAYPGQPGYYDGDPGYSGYPDMDEQGYPVDPAY